VPLTVATETGVVPFTPTNTQLVPAKQLSALTAVNDDATDESAVHWAPPLLVTSMGAAAPL